MDFRDIPQFPRAHYTIDIEWRRLARFLAEDCEGLDLNPDYQRAHVWTEEQKRAYVEYILKGGDVARTVIVNAPKWEPHGYEGATLVDGKQRLSAILDFMENRLPIFGGNRYCDFTGWIRTVNARVQWSVVILPTRAELLQLYLNINAGGTPHAPEEINRVRELLAKELE